MTTCSFCDGTGQLLQRVRGGVVSELVPCFACSGRSRAAVIATREPVVEPQGSLFEEVA